MKLIPRLRKPDNAAISQEVIILATPVIMSNLSRTVMNLADVAMVGRLGTDALAATGMGAMLVWIILSLSISIRTATQALVSRRLGQKIYHECGVATRNGLMIALVVGLPLSIIGFKEVYRFVPFFVKDASVIKLSTDYTSIVFLSVFFSMIGFVFQGFYTGIERTKIHMKATVTANVLNIYLNAGLIYGSDGLHDFFSGSSFSWIEYLWTWTHFPALGVKGAALATVISSIWLALHYFIYLFSPEIKKRYQIFRFTLDRKMGWRQIKLATPQGLQEMLIHIGFAFFYKIVAMIGIVELAATQVVFTILQTSFMPAAGIGQGCAALVGKYLGEEKHDLAEDSITESIRWSLIIMGSLGVLFLIFPHQILSFFTTDPAVIAAGVNGLRILGIVQFIDAYGMTLWFALSGAGNTKFPAILEVTLVYFFFLPGVYLMGITFGMGFIGAWLSMAGYIAIYALAIGYKVYQGDWKNIEL